MKNLFNSFNGKKIMIVGDMMLDIYMNGKVERISPEAPVPIVSVTKTFSRLGGAANVAQNLKALGAEPILCSVIGKDEKSNDLISLMLEHNMNTSGIVKSDERITTTKVRIIGNNAQMLRVDTEDTFDLTEKEYDSLIDKISEIANAEKIDGIILQDYNKGVLTERLIKEAISIANKKNIPIGVDPKKKNFLAYQNVTFFKPNLKELKEGIGISAKDDSIEEIVKAVDALQCRLNCRYVMTTLSERGVLIKDYETNAWHHIPAHLRKIADVSGAGDTVLSVAMLCLICKEDAYNIAALSNLAGGLVCEEIGAVPINKERLFEESKKYHNK
jgi:rfaE bifunctional protein kinase chain/domain